VRKKKGKVSSRYGVGGNACTPRVRKGGLNARSIMPVVLSLLLEAFFVVGLVILIIGFWLSVRV